MRRTKNPWRVFIEAAILVIAGAYMIHVLADGWQAVSNRLASINWWLIVAGILVFITYFLIRAIAWGGIMRNFKQPLSFRHTLRIWCISELNRYMPGNVWSFVSRVYLADKVGVPKKITLASLAAEIILMLGGATIFVGIFFGSMPFNFSSDLRWLLILGLPALVLIASPNLLENLINFLLMLMKRPRIDLKISRAQVTGILLLYFIGWLAYGLASYLVLQAFGVDYSASIIWIISSVIIAWIIGYVSLVTPMGLGVREVTTVFLLGQVMPSSLASLIAVAARLTQILSELIVLAGILLLRLEAYRTRSKEWRSWFRENWVEIILVACIVSFIGYFTAYTFARHSNFVSSRFDLGIMDQVVWNTAHGHIFQLTTPDGTATVPRFSIHADVFLILLAPLYWVVSSPYVLLLVQVVVVALGALPLYWLGRDVIKNKPLALIIALGYLFFAPLERAVIFDFHAVTLASSFLIYAFYYLYKKKYWPYAVFALLALSTKETLALTVIALGVYAILAKKDWRVGVATIFISGLWFYLLLWWIMPSARGDGSAHFALSYYSLLGNTPGQIVRTAIFKPWVWLPALFNNANLHYLGFFFVPVGLLAALSPVALLTVPEFMLNLLSNDWAMHTFYFQYTSVLTPFIFVAAVFGARRLLIWAPSIAAFIRLELTDLQLTRTLTIYLVVVTLFMAWWWSPLPGMRQADVGAFTYHDPSETYLHHLESQIPPTASVAATTHLEPHFSERQYIYPFPTGIDQADYIIIQEGDDSEIVPTAQISAAARQVEQDPNYTEIYHQGLVSVFKKV